MTPRRASDARRGPARDGRLSSPSRIAIERGAGFLVLWVVLMPSAKPADLAVGAIATAAATWVSLRLLPPATGCLRFGALLGAPAALPVAVGAGGD